jgi:hypothetical protein
MKKQPTAGVPFFGAFPSDRIPIDTKDGQGYFFIHSLALLPLMKQFL